MPSKLNLGEAIVTTTERYSGLSTREPRKLSTLSVQQMYVIPLVKYLYNYHRKGYWKVQRDDGAPIWTFVAADSLFNCGYAFIQGCKAMKQPK